jgi:hypothetical protein
MRSRTSTCQSHANLFDDQSQQLLALSEIQIVQVRCNALGKLSTL